jgi:hypothetical protein
MLGGVVLMSMRKNWVILASLSAVLMVSGCRFKGVEGFEKATTPVDYVQQNKENNVQGDPYANGGIAYASAGKRVHTRYGTGANMGSTDKIDPKMDQPAKGTGQQPGELGGDADGHGQSNAPANQGSAQQSGASTH